MSADLVGAASSEEGLTTKQPTPSTSNLGTLQLRAAGVPTAATTLNLALQRGGLPLGEAVPRGGVASTTTPPGAALRWKQSTDGATVWRGATQEGYLTYARQISVATALTDYPRVSRPRHLGNDSVGFLRITDGVGAVTLSFLHKSSRTASWSAVTIGTGFDAAYAPDFVVLPDGRLIAYAQNDDGVVEANYSDDDGATWAAWSADTGVGFATSSRALCAEVVGNSIAIATGGTPDSYDNGRLYWSMDGGQTFTQSGDDMAETGPIATTVAADGTLLLWIVDDATTSGVLYRLSEGATWAVGDSVGTSLDASRATIAITAHDDGSVWRFQGIQTAGGVGGQATSAIAGYVSYDHGATWYQANNTTSTRVFDNATDTIGTSYGFNSYHLGSWKGSLVCICVTDGSVAAEDDSLQELWFGGWDTITEAATTTTSTATNGTAYYNKGAYTAIDIPDNLGWTRTDTAGAGATVDVDANGLHIVAAGDNTYYTAPAAIWSPTSGDANRFRFVFRCNTGGDVASNLAIVKIAYADGGGLQTFATLRVSRDQLRLVDTAGPLASSSNVGGQFADWTEVLIAFEHATSATTSTISVWYRINSSAAWTALASGVSVAEGGAGAAALIFGGDAAGAVNWHVALLAPADGGGNLPDGFTNPTDLRGRGLSPLTSFYVYNGVKIGAFGGFGNKGDAYTSATTYTHAARNLWLTERPSCRWQTTGDNVDANVVLGDGATSRMIVRAVLLVGTNVATAKWQMNATDAWAPPSFEVTMSAVVWNGAVSLSYLGAIVVDGEPWIPGEFRTVPGRRWFLQFTASGDTYEIADNDAGAIYVPTMAASYAGAACRIFGDRMGVLLPTEQRYAYARLLIEAQQTADNEYRVGTPFIGVPHEFELPYDTGFVDESVPNVRVYETDSGRTSATRRGGNKHRMRLAWAPIDRLTTRYMDKLATFMQALDGERQIVGFWRDTTDVRTIGAYRVSGPVARENVYGEREDALERLAQLVLTEEQP